LAENYVARALNGQSDNKLYYWTSNGEAEVDYIIETKGVCIPIGVNSSINTKIKSLAIYNRIFYGLL